MRCQYGLQDCIRAQVLVSITGDVNSISDWSTAPLATHQAAA
jgi:hypothetical protein